MRPTLDKRRVQDWLRGQRAAERRVEEERSRFLIHLTPDEALRLYLSLQEAAPLGQRDAGPSPVLVAMRQLLDRYAQRENVRE